MCRIKSLVFYIKNKTFYCLCCPKIGKSMIIAKQVKQKIETIPEGVVLALKTFKWRPNMSLPL